MINKYPILILHGWNLDAVKYRPLQIELEEKGYQVYVCDLPGFGSSNISEKSLFLSDYIDFVERYISKHKLNKVILIGHSFGGRIGIKLAAKKPKYLAALILTGTPGINPVPKFKILFFHFLAKAGKAVFFLPVLANARGLFRKFLYKLADAGDYYNTKDYMLETFKNTVKESLITYLKQIHIPTLLIWGRQDKMVPVEIAEKMNKLLDNSRLVVVNNSRHGLPWTHPQEFTNEVEKFLNNL